MISCKLTCSSYKNDNEEGKKYGVLTLLGTLVSSKKNCSQDEIVGLVASRSDVSRLEETPLQSDL